ncbi:ABC transporter ATP-binding protein, partial [Candidatus Gottesmanbacteria bacterium]|nr:ABC transporter ATP-binding protein [Candidatus Gottesmanbacteria bacterium]
VKTHGRIVSLIDLEAGFHPDLTGIQNIFLNGMLLGMKKEEIERKLDAIIRFADIRQFIDVPLYTYSSGMKLRLGFAVAVHADPDILILDEGVNVGDQEFRKKIQNHINKNLIKQAMIIVSHEAGTINAFANRIFILEKGKINL